MCKFALVALLIAAPGLALAQTSSALPATSADITSVTKEVHGVHNDIVYGNGQLATKLDTLHADMQALIKQLQAAPASTTTTSTSSSTAAAPSGDAVTAKYFPTDAALAAFPSPENSRIIRNADGSVSGRPYLEDKEGNVHRMVAATGRYTNGYTVNGNPALGGGSDGSPITALIVRQGEVYVTVSPGGQTQHFNTSSGGLYNASLPDAFSTDASGQTTSTVAVSSVSAPAPAARQSPAPGTSGKVLNVCASGCAYTTISGAIGAAAAGDTVDIGSGVYKEAPPAWMVPLKIVFETGASMDLTGLTGSLARGKGALVPVADSIIVNPVITGTAMDQGSAQGTAAIRPDLGCGYLDIQGGTLSGNQNGIAGGDVPVTLTVTDTKLSNNGLGDGYTHNMYMSHGTLSVTLTNVQSSDPNGGHAAKLRAYAVTINGGSYDAFAAAAIDIPDGTVAAGVIDGATITKKAGAYNHTVLDYATEDTTSGNGGLTVRNVAMNLLCDSPVILVGGGSVVTVEATTKITGTKPTSQGGTVKGL